MGFLSRHKRAFITVVVILCIGIMGVTTMYQFNPVWLGYVVTPVQQAFTDAGGWISDKVDFLKHMSDLEAENIRLRALNKELEAENSRLSAIRKENEELAIALNLKSKYADLPIEGANIVASDPGNWYAVYWIDKGEDAGFQKNMAVLAQGGLAGRIDEVGKTSSRIVSIIDDRSSVSARSTKTGDTGFVKGDTRLMMEGKCRMELIAGDADIAVGDTIETGQLSSIYPPGILIGTVIEISNDPNGTKTAIIEPVVSFDSINMVHVVTEIYEAIDINGESIDTDINTGGAGR